MKHLLNTLYILTPESDLFLQNDTISVKVGGAERIRVPAHTIDSIYCFGNVTVSTPLIGFCGEHGIHMVFLSEYGKFYGRIQGPLSGNILLRRQQFAALEDPVRRTQLVKSILLGKLVNGKLFLQRQKREREDANGKIAHAIDKLTEAAKNLQEAKTVDSMRGIEGAAAVAYFSAIPNMLQGTTLTFSGRTRRPPEDPVNSVLSFLYTLLKNDVQSALESVGLDPAAGFLHTLRPGRPALALDLMEELRAPFCDRLAIALFNRKQITEDSFEQLNAPVLLNEKGRKTILSAWQKRKQETVRHPFLEETVPIGLIPYVQAKLLARVLRGELDEYPPIIWR